MASRYYSRRTRNYKQQNTNNENNTKKESSMTNNMTDTERLINRFVVEWSEMRLKNNTQDTTQIILNTLTSEEGKVIMKKTIKKLQDVLTNNEKFKEMRNAMDIFQMVEQLNSADSETLSNILNSITNNEESKQDTKENTNEDTNEENSEDNNEEYDEEIYPDEYDKQEDV